MKVWAIKHKPTGKWMPARMYKGGGWSYWNPGHTPQYLSTEEVPFDPTPRLFATLPSVRNALTAWLQGEWDRSTKREGDWETGYYDVTAEPEPSKPPVERKRGDMEIVELELLGA